MPPCAVLVLLKPWSPGGRGEAGPVGLEEKVRYGDEAGFDNRAKAVGEVVEPRGGATSFSALATGPRGDGPALGAPLAALAAPALAMRATPGDGLGVVPSERSAAIEVRESEAGGPMALGVVRVGVSSACGAPGGMKPLLGESRSAGTMSGLAGAAVRRGNTPAELSGVMSAPLGEIRRCISPARSSALARSCSNSSL